MQTATIFDIQHGSFADGPGIRTTVFFKGCNLRCAWCHNPESQSGKPELMVFRDRCADCGLCRKRCPTPEKCTLCGKCTLICPEEVRKVCGRAYTLEEVMEEIVRDQSFYRNSGGGVTCSGGECMLQVDFLAELLRRCTETGIHTAVDTAGYVPFSSFERICEYTDLFLYDLKAWDGEKHRQYTGVDNGLILENLQKLDRMGKRIWIRIPVVPGVNDRESEMRKIRQFLDTCSHIERVELLPYHPMGENKSAALGRQPHVFETPGEETMETLRRIMLT